MNLQDTQLYRTPSCSILMWFLRLSSRLVLNSQREQERSIPMSWTVLMCRFRLPIDFEAVPHILHVCRTLACSRLECSFSCTSVFPTYTQLCLSQGYLVLVLWDFSCFVMFSGLKDRYVQLPTAQAIIPGGNAFT